MKEHQIPAALFPSVSPVKTGGFPHQAYRATCSCASGQPKERRNYAGHIIAPPTCSSCSKPYQLDITLMPTFQPR
jgi:hypothetical protein